MKAVLSWIFFSVVLLAALLAAAVVVYTYVHPSVNPLHLQRMETYAGNIADAVFFGSILLAGLFLVFPSLRAMFLKWTTNYRAEMDLWHVKLCQILMGIAFLIIVFSLSYLGIKFENGQWMVGGGKGESWHVVSQANAVLYLWRDLRVYVAFVLFVTLGWLLIAMTFIKCGCGRRKEKTSQTSPNDAK